MNLREPIRFRRDGGNQRALKRSRRDDYTVGFERTVRGLDNETLVARIAHHFLHFDARADRRVEFLCIGDEVIRDLILRREAIGIDLGELQIRETIVPRGSIGNQRIPASRAPPLGDARALQHDMRHADVAQMFAHRHAGLTGADHERVD